LVGATDTMEEYDKARKSLLLDLDLGWLGEHLKRAIISIVFNKKYELEFRDISKIVKFLDPIKHQSATIIIDGEGGCDRSGKYLALYLKKKFKKHLSFFVPNSTGSAMNYPVLAGSGVMLGPKSHMTPIDPHFKYKDRMYRAILRTRDSDRVIRNKARRHVKESIDFTLRLFHFPGTMVNNIENYNINMMERFVRKFFLNKDHDTPITFDDLEQIGLVCAQYDADDPLWITLKDYYHKAIQDLDKWDKKFLIESTLKHKFYR